MPHRPTCFSRQGPWLPALLLALAGDAEAASFPRTDAEFARLPPYCAARLRRDGNPAAYDQWQRRLTMNCFIHVHHYCAALNDVQLALRSRSKAERDQHLRDSMAGGFDYMWNQAGASCPMMPEILTSKGQALLMMEQPQDAGVSFRKAMDLNPRYVPAYVALADLYRRSNQIDAARELLNYARKIEPDNKTVLRHLAELNAPGVGGGGK